MNILLLTMSLYNNSNLCNTNNYVDEKHHKFDGRMTNEAPTKKVIFDLKEKGEKLDKVVMICSKKAETGLIKDNSKLISEETKELIGDKTHKEFFVETIVRYAKEMNTNIPKFENVIISDSPNKDEAVKTIVDLATKIEDNVTKINDLNLFIDFNGGQRFVPHMMVALANLLKIKGVKNVETLSMNFDNKVKENGVEYIKIQNLDVVFNIGNLVSAVNEYVNYGRVKTLKNYFDPYQDPEVDKVIKVMEKFAESLQLCRIDLIFNNISELKVALSAYRKVYLNKTELVAYEILFLYVLDYIQEEYEPLFNGDLPDIIQWCSEKDFVQQALTLYVERMPKYFYEKGIFKPTKDEECEYMAFLEYTEELGKEIFKLTGQEENKCSDFLDCEKKDFVQQALTSYVEKMAKYFYKREIFRSTEQEESECSEFLDYKKNLEELEPSKLLELLKLLESLNNLYNKHYINYDRDYSWFNKYINKRSNIVNITSKINTILMKLSDDNKGDNKFKDEEKYKCFNKYINDSYKNLPKKLYDEAVNNLKNLMLNSGWFSNKKHIRVETKLLEEEKLYKLLLNYFILKKQRNLSNHASKTKSQGKKEIALSCELIKKILEISLNIIKAN